MADAAAVSASSDRPDALERRPSAVSEAISQLFASSSGGAMHGGVAAQQTNGGPLSCTAIGGGGAAIARSGFNVAALTSTAVAPSLATDSPIVGAAMMTQLAASPPASLSRRGSDSTLGSLALGVGAMGLTSAASVPSRGLAMEGANSAAMVGSRDVAAAASVPDASIGTQPVPVMASTATAGPVWDPAVPSHPQHPHSHIRPHSHGHHHARHGSSGARAFTAGSSAAAAAAAAAVAAGPITLAPVPSPALSFLHKSGSFDSPAALSIRQRIRKQISGMMQDKATRDKDEIAREWGAILARWNEFQPAVSSGGGVGSTGGVSASTLANNQRKLSALLMTTGIPAHMRASVWLLIIGNGLGLAPSAFEALRSSCAEKRAHYEEWRRRTNSNHQGSDSQLSNDSDNAAAGSPSESFDGSSASASSSPPADVSLDPAYAAFSLIDQDLPRTFPELQFFHNDGPYQQPLREVLECTAAFRAQRERERAEAAATQQQQQTSGVETRLPSPSVASSGYVQGMSHLGSILLLALGDDAFLAFVALSNLLENPAEPLSALLSMRADVGALWMRRFDLQLQQSLPSLHAHFTAIGLQGEMWLYKMVLSVFAQSLDLDAVFRVWDCYLWESFKNRASNSHSPVTPRMAPAAAPSPTASSATSGGAPAPAQCGSGFPFLFRVALGLLSMYADSLCQVGFEDALYFLHHLPGKQSLNAPPAAAPQAADDDLDIDLLFQHIRTIRMQPNVWENNAV